MAVPRYKKQPKMGQGAGPSGPIKIPLEAVPYTAAGGMKPRSDAQKALDALKGFYENMIKPTGPGFDEKIAEMQAVKIPPFMAPSSSPYASRLTTPWMGAVGKKAQLGLEAIANSNWGSFFGANEVLNVGKGTSKPMDLINFASAYAPFGLGKLSKTAKPLVGGLKALKEILDTNK